MNKPKLLLSTLNLDNNYSNLGLLNLKSSLLNNKQLENRLSVDCKNYDIHLPSRKIINEIKQIQPDYIGFSTFVWNIDKILEICRKLKKKDNDLTIILGGVYVSPIAKKIIRENPQIDIIIRGEGEITVQKLFQNLLADKSKPADVRGITFRKNNQIKSTQSRQPISNLDKIPSPYLESDQEFSDNKIATIEIQRGCPYGCYYCYYPHGLKKNRYFSLARVKKEIKYLLGKNINKILISAPSFNTDLARAKKIANFIAKTNSRNIEIWVDINAEKVDGQFAQLLNKANMRVQVGLQSKNKKVLNKVNRNLNIQKFEEGYSLLKENNVYILLNLILGLPGSTTKKFLDSLRYSLKLEPDDLWTFQLMVLPGTMLWENAEQLGIKYQSTPPHTVLKTSSLDKNEIKYLLHLAYAVKYIHQTNHKWNKPDEKITLARKWIERSNFWNRKLAPQLRTINNKELEKDFSQTFETINIK